MEPMRRSFFADHPFRWPSCAARYLQPRRVSDGIYARNLFRRGATRGFCWSQSQAGLVVQPFFGLRFRLRWSGSAVDGLSVFGYGLAARARVLSVLARVLSVLARVLTVNLGESARIGEFGRRHHRVFRHFLLNKQLLTVCHCRVILAVYGWK